jgi:L-alanine-DL-glutamate epimerase-like enolase superfamily enzyme
MKIKAIRAYLEKIPLTKPYTISYQTFSDTEIVYLEIELENGIIGLGAANPFVEVVGETPLSTLLHLQSDFVQQLIGRDINDFSIIIEEVISHFKGFPGTQAAIDIALHDAFGKFTGISVLDIYKRTTGPLPTSITIGIKDASEMLEEAKEYFGMGFRALKIKTGRNIEQDIECVSKLSNFFGHSMRIRVDANQGYNIKELFQFLDAAEKLKIELIEQPLPTGMEKELLAIPYKFRKILVADESLIDEDSAIYLKKIGSPYGVYNIKLMKCGGIQAANKIQWIAYESDCKLFWGCNDESLISITAALHAAYSCINTKYLDLDGSLDVMEKTFMGGFILKDGLMFPNDLPGLGVSKL